MTETCIEKPLSQPMTNCHFCHQVTPVNIIHNPENNLYYLLLNAHCFDQKLCCGSAQWAYAYAES